MPPEGDKYALDYFGQIKNKTEEISTDAIIIGSTPTELTVGLSNRYKLIFYVDDDRPIFIGDINVTVNNGFGILPGIENQEVLFFDPQDDNVNLYAIAEENTSVRIREEA